MTAYHLAQLNIAQLAHPIDSPPLTDFVANIERINALAEKTSGFIWRYQTPVGDTLEAELFGADHIVNMSVWVDKAALHHYVYHTAHIEIMRRKQEWFENMRESHMVLWWVPVGCQPSLIEAREKLQGLRQQGVSPQHFSFKQDFPAPAN
ncbi:DUF3291 domain-containing protein [Eionea flava]